MTPKNNPKFSQARETLSAIMHDSNTPNPVAILSLTPLFAEGKLSREKIDETRGRGPPCRFERTGTLIF